MNLETLIPVLRRELALPTLEIVVREDFRAGHRQQIRQALVDSLKPDEIEAQTLLMLDHVPNPAHASVSISHTPSLGGFAFTRSHSPSIGFDLEDIARVHERAVARVSRPEELSQAPSVARIWVAKEAAYKALHGRVPVISSLITGAWRSVLSQENLSLWSCEVREDSHSNPVCRGLTVELSNTALGIFVAEGGFALN